MNTRGLWSRSQLTGRVSSAPHSIVGTDLSYALALLLVLQVYRRVRLETFMGGSSGVEADGVLKRSLYNKPMGERIMEPGNNEARLVLGFLTCVDSLNAQCVL